MTVDRQALLGSVDLEALLESIGSARDLRRRGKQFPCPVADHEQTGGTPPVAVAADPAGYQIWKCHSCEAGGTAIDALLASGHAADVGEAFEQLGGGDRNGSRNGDRHVVERYSYVDEHGVLLYQVERMEPKGFRQRRPDGSGGWIWKLDDVRRVLYHLPRALAAIEKGETVYVAEGERDVHAVEAAGAVATCNPMGAGKDKWLPEFSEALRGADVVIVADRDEAGRKHALAVAASLDGIAAKVKLLEPATGKDVADHLSAGRTLDQLVEPVEGSGEKPRLRVVVGGGEFVFDTPAKVTAVWGSGQQVFWASGEPAMIAAPNGVGKTTLTQQLVLRRIGLRRGLLLGQPVAVGKRVLYIAADRPQQAARSLRRMVREGDRGKLDERLKVWRGPLPFDLLKDPSQLAAFTESFDADALIIDSLKDIVVKLASDEVGAIVNMAIQECIARGIEVVSDHHQRKSSADNKEPSKLDDVYGSVWLTAGQGSVILLWGESGDPIVTLRHLKSPAEEIGPLKLSLDFPSGRIEIREDTSIEKVLAAALGGLSARDTAVQLYGSKPSDAEVEKARRKLDKLVERGYATRERGLGPTDPAIYRVELRGQDDSPANDGKQDPTAENSVDPRGGPRGVSTQAPRADEPNGESPATTGQPNSTQPLHGAPRTPGAHPPSKEGGDVRGVPADPPDEQPLKEMFDEALRHQQETGDE